MLENTLEIKDTYVLNVFGLSQDIGKAPKVNGEFVRKNSAIFFPDFPFYFLPTQEAVYGMELVLKEKESVQDDDSTACFFSPEDSGITKSERANFVGLLKSNAFISNSSGAFCCAIEDDGNTWSVYRLENGELKIETNDYWTPRSISANNLAIQYFPDTSFSPKRHQGDSAWGVLQGASGKIVFHQHRHLKFSVQLRKVLQHLADICQEKVGVLNVAHREGTALVFVGTSLVATAKEDRRTLSFQPDFWKSSWAIDFLWDAQTIAMLSDDTYNQIAWIFVEDGEEERSWFSTIFCNQLYYQRIQDDSEIFVATCARWIEQQHRFRSGSSEPLKLT